jgi:hypothetical protein
VFDASECRIHGIKSTIIKTAAIINYSWAGQFLLYLEGKWGYFKLTVAWKPLQEKLCSQIFVTYQVLALTEGLNYINTLLKINSDMISETLVGAVRML